MPLVRYKLAVLAGSVIALCASTAVRSQTCPVAWPERLRTDAIVQKAERVSAILDELAARRQTFLDKGDVVELFPMLYYHSTLAEFQNAVTLPPDDAEVVLDIVIAFYDAYEHNRTLFDRRGAGAVERHWRDYYRKAANAKNTASRQFVSILLDGVDAHLDDLARTLRYTFERTKLNDDRLKELYYSLDATFSDVVKAAEADIRNVRNDSLIRFESSLGLGFTYVVHARHRAWEAAVAKGGLRAKGPHPTMPHEKRSRTFFTLEPGSDCSMKVAQH